MEWQRRIKINLKRANFDISFRLTIVWTSWPSFHWLQGSCWCEPCYHQYNGELVSEEYFELIFSKYFKQFVLSIFCFSETGNSPFKCVCLCPDFHRTFRQYIHSFRCRFTQLRFPQRTWGVHSGRNWFLDLSHSFGTFKWDINLKIVPASANNSCWSLKILI